MLTLRAVEVRDEHHWRWVLTDPVSGTPLADHTVALDAAAPEAEAFGDLHHYLMWRADPDQRAESAAALLARVGEWIGAQVLGERICRQIVAAAPVTVRVEVPDAADWLLYRPLELAYLDGVPLARRGDVSLVYDLGSPGPGKRPVGDRLRMVAVFSLPTEETALGLRRERYELARLVRRLGARRGRAVDLRVLQYGVTRERLAEAMTDEGGPDVLHISGHGRGGEIRLETSTGSTDPVPTGELLRLLAQARARVKLAMVSACESAAATVAETLGLLGLTEAAAQAASQAAASGAARSVDASGLAHRLARELDCAVVAMRYPVYDEFAIALAGQLYDGLFHLRLPVDKALPRAVPVAAGDEPSLSRPAISIATPTLFGARAVDLSLTPPRRRADLDVDEQRMAHFPAEPPRFVGRARAMATATTALAPDSGHTGVLFHGMAGAGKTACALELAYRHEDAFAGGLVFWQAPTRDDDEFGAALAGLALALEQQLGGYGFTIVDKIGTPDALRAFLPRLSRLLAGNGLLLVLDNLETLLTAEGNWRDARWADLVAALTGHDGESRVVLTSRTRPAGLDGQVLVQPVHTLSRDESVLLARELPHLRDLLHTEPAPTRRSKPEVDADRATVTEVLRLVQGHPKLLELADAAAADPDTLATHLAAARDVAQPHGPALAAFFHHGESDLDADGFLDILTTWTTSTLHTLPDDARLLLQMLCLLEEDDRVSFVVEGNWADLWHRLNRPGDPPDLDPLLTTLATAALVHPDGDGDLVGYRIHPGIADAVRTGVPAELRTAVDTTLATWWRTVARDARQREEGERTQTVMRAGLAAAPYLTRLADWHTAATLLEQALLRDQTPAVVQAALPHLRRIATTTGTPAHLGTLALALTSVDPTQAEQILRQTLDQAATAHDYHTASAIGGRLANLLQDTGRLHEALTIIDRKTEHTRQAGLGPWTQLADRSQRLQILYRLGQAEQILTELDTLRGQMDTLPDQPGPDDPVNPWNVRELTLETGMFAALDLRRWQQALDLNTEIHTSKQIRGAGPHQIAHTRFNDYGPLLRLDRLDQAETLLRDCQQVFEDHHDIPMLGKVLGARADVAAQRGHHSDAIAFEKTALRLSYVKPNPDDVAVSHHNLANLARSGTDPTGQLAHRLAAALIRHLTGMQRELDNSTRALARDLRTLGDQAQPPTTLAEVAAQVEPVDGVRFAALIGTLAPDPDTAQAALDEILHTARTLPDEQASDLQRHLDEWEQDITALVAGVEGDQAAAATVGEVLAGLAGSDDWGALVGVLRRILGGERDPDALLAGLDPVDTVIVRTTLDRLST